MKNLLELTSIRAFAAVYVVMFHVFNYLPAIRDLPTHFFRKGYLGVDLFFILSGFILSHAYAGATAAKAFSYREFMVARLARVYPLHLAVLIIFVAIYGAAELLMPQREFSGADWAALPYHILLLQGFGFTSSHSWNFPSWSISAEFFAYLFFPAFIWLTYRTGRWALPGAITIFVVAFAIGEQNNVRLTALMYNGGIVRIAFEFLIGCSLYSAFRSMEARRWHRWLALGVTTSLLMALHLGTSDILIVPLLALLLLAVAFCSVLEQSNVLRTKALIYLGEVSYSTYMVHYLILLVIYTYLGIEPREDKGLPYLWLGGAILAIYAASIIAYEYLEVPSRTWLRRKLSGPALAAPMRPAEGASP